MTSAGELDCWGGPGFALDSAAFQALGPWATVSTFNYNACAIRQQDGTLQCWGSVPEVVDEVPEGAFVDVATALSFACALDANGSPTCWGRFYQEPEIPEPHPGPFTRLFAGENFVCGLLRADATARCWGLEATLAEVAPPEDLPLRQLDGSLGHLCGITLDGQMRCWGDDSEGRATPPD